MGHNPVSLEPARWHSANRRACVCKPLLVSRRKSVVMAGGTSRPRAVGDVTSVDTGSISGSIPSKKKSRRYSSKNRYCVPVWGRWDMQRLPLSGVVKFVDYCAGKVAPTSDIAPASS